MDLITQGILGAVASQTQTSAKQLDKESRSATHYTEPANHIKKSFNALWSIIIE